MPLLLILTIYVSTHPLNIYIIKSNTTFITSCDDSAEFIIENHTQGLLGYLHNTHDGRTVFTPTLVKPNEVSRIIVADTRKMSNSSPDAWLTGRNSFGTTGCLGKIDIKNLDIIGRNVIRMRVDTFANVFISYAISHASNTSWLDINILSRTGRTGETKWSTLTQSYFKPVFVVDNTRMPYLSSISTVTSAVDASCASDHSQLERVRYMHRPGVLTPTQLISSATPTIYVKHLQGGNMRFS